MDAESHHKINVMIFYRPRITTDIYPETPPSNTHKPDTHSSERCVKSPSFYLALPTEIRLQIHYYYLLSLNIPDCFFTHLTMLGYWRDGGGVVTRFDTRGYDLGRRISKPLLTLLLLNHQIQTEAKDVLYRRFVFPIHPNLSSADAVHSFYSATGNGARPASQLRKIQINLSFMQGLGISASHAVVEEWRAALQALVVRLPELRTVGLAVDYLPISRESTNLKEMLDVIVSFAQIFKSQNVQLRFADVDYDRYGFIAPVSSPVCSELLDEEALLLHLRDEKKLIWHHVALHFHDPRSEMYSVNGLQARYERLKARQWKVELQDECLKILKQ